MVLELNASDDRGIDVVREQIKTFASTKQIFSASTQNPAKFGVGAFKLIILDEADAMTSAAQMALRRIMEKYTANTRFCIIANYTHKLTPALLSRCTRFRFSPLKEVDIRRLVDQVIEGEGVNIAPDAVDALVKLSKGDMRRALNVLQACHAGSKPLPTLNGDGGKAGSAAAAASRQQKPGQRRTTDEQDNELITVDTVYTCIASPHPSDIQMVLTTLLSTTDATSALSTINSLKSSCGLALADILSALAEELSLLDVPAATKITWLQGLAEIEHRVAAGGNEQVQTGGMVGVVRAGCELLGRKGVELIDADADADGGGGGGGGGRGRGRRGRVSDAMAVDVDGQGNGQ